MSDHFEAVIVGGSYAGLSAAMALGRALRKVLIIDSGRPCNRQAPHAHNFITQDGEKPAVIASKAKAQVLAYPSVQWLDDTVSTAYPMDEGFGMETVSGKKFFSRKLLFTTGVEDLLPDIPGFKDCWGISIIHCPYCHGYEVRGKKTGILANGDVAFEFLRTINQWTKDLTLFTNGPSTLTDEQQTKIAQKGIQIVETPIRYINHHQGQLSGLYLQSQEPYALDALYARLPFRQHCTIPQQLGCAMTEPGYLAVDEFQQTNIGGVFAAGDNTNMFRSISMAVAAGGKAGALINHDLIKESF